MNQIASPGSQGKRSYLIKKERDDRGWPRSNGLWEAEGTEERRCAKKSWEECEDGKEVELRNEEKF